METNANTNIEILETYRLETYQKYSEVLIDYKYIYKSINFLPLQVTNHYSLLFRDSPASNPITYPTGLACTTVLRRSMKKFPTRLKAALLCPMEGINATFSKEKTWIASTIKL